MGQHKAAAMWWGDEYFRQAKASVHGWVRVLQYRYQHRLRGTLIHTRAGFVIPPHGRASNRYASEVEVPSVLMGLLRYEELLNEEALENRL